MDRPPGQKRDQQRTVVDLRTRKRRPNIEHVVNTVDQPQEKILALPKIIFYEGTHKDIVALTEAEPLLENKGVFLKGKIPNPFGVKKEITLIHGGFSKNVCVYSDTTNPSMMMYVRKVVEAKKFNINEVKHMCQLIDFYICQIYGLVRSPDEYHIYMEYCGKSLYDLVKDTPFLPDQIVDITKQLCMAVEFAHNKKILHLDIKPRNICLLFTSHGIQLKLTDWGSSVLDSPCNDVLNITPIYASPELLYFYICQAMLSCKIENTDLEKARQLTQTFSRNYNNIETVSTMSDSFSIGLTVMFVKNKAHLYANNKMLYKNWYLFENFAKNPDTAKALLPDQKDFLTSIVWKLVEGDSHKRSSVKEVIQILRDHQQNCIMEVSKEIIQTNNIPIPEEEQLNIPNFDLLL